MNVLVVGGSGFVGSHLAAELVDRGHDVTVLSRHPEEGDLPAGVATYAGDVTDYESIEGAFEGQDAVVYLVALSPLFKPRGGEQRHFEVHLGGTENVVRAAEAHGVDRYVHQSNLGVYPDAPTSYFRAKAQAEDVVRDSDLDWVVFRPSIIFGEGGEFVRFTLLLSPPPVAPLPGGGTTPFQPIWVEEFVPMMTDAVEEDRHVGQTYDVGGPAVLTIADVAKLGRRAKGHPLVVVPLPMALARVALALADPIPFVPFGTDQFRSLQYDNRVEDNDLDAFGVSEADLTTLGEYLGVTE